MKYFYLFGTVLVAFAAGVVIFSAGYRSGYIQAIRDSAIKHQLEGGNGP